ncbi:MAG: response regulator [Anaerolineales bacterium]|jgi:two-component system response regulator VicR
MEKPLKRVIYFEDENDMVELVRIILGREGYAVEGVREGLVGLQAIKEDLPDLILLDLMMPDMDGWEIFRQIKNDEAIMNIPIIVITAKAQTVDKVLGLEIAKVDDYISKPFRPHELVERVEKVLSEHEM